MSKSTQSKSLAAFASVVNESTEVSTSYHGGQGLSISVREGRIIRVTRWVVGVKGSTVVLTDAPTAAMVGFGG